MNKITGYEKFAYYYDELTQNIDYQARGEYFHKILCSQQKAHGLLLDLACGTGTLSEYFAKMGYDVIGVDASQEMLSVAEQKKMDNGSHVLYLCQSMQDLNLFGTVDIVLCALDSLNHIIHQDQLRLVFERISLFLNPESLFVFDMNTLYKHQHILNNQIFSYDSNQVYCIWQNKLFKDYLIQITLDLFIRQGKEDVYHRVHEQFYERAYEIESVIGLLEQTGFDLLHLYEADTFHVPKEDTQRVIFVCKNRICKNKIGIE